MENANAVLLFSGIQMDYVIKFQIAQPMHNSIDKQLNVSAKKVFLWTAKDLVLNWKIVNKIKSLIPQLVNASVFQAIALIWMGSVRNK